MGVGRPALYRQFADRADLDRAVADRAGDLLVTDVVSHLRPGDDLDVIVADALRAYLDHVQANLHLYRFVRAHDSGTVGRVKDSVGGRIAALTRDLLLSTGSAADTADTLATAVVGMVDAVIGRWLDEPAGVGRDELLRRLGVLVRGAVAAVLKAEPRR